MRHGEDVVKHHKIRDVIVLEARRVYIMNVTVKHPPETLHLYGCPRPRKASKSQPACEDNHYSCVVCGQIHIIRGMSQQSRESQFLLGDKT